MKRCSPSLLIKGNANQKYNEIPPHTLLHTTAGWLLSKKKKKKKQKKLRGTGKEVEALSTTTENST